MLSLAQTAYRAELTGVCEAIRFAQRARCPVRLWCDCQGVVNGLKGLLCGTPAVWQLANMQRSPAFWKAHTTFKQQIEEEARRAHHIQHTLLSISRAVLYQHHADQAAGTEAEMEPEISQSAAACPAPWPGIPEVAGCPRDLIDCAAGCHLNL